jgi:hypothetical protein
MSAVRRQRVPPFAVDVLVAVVAAAAGSAREIASPNFDTKYIVAPVWVYVVAQLLAAATLLARRHRPYTAALTVAGGKRVAGSNPVSPTEQKASYAGLLHV